MLQNQEMLKLALQIQIFHTGKYFNIFVLYILLQRPLYCKYIIIL